MVVVGWGAGLDWTHLPLHLLSSVLKAQACAGSCSIVRDLRVHMTMKSSTRLLLPNRSWKLYGVELTRIVFSVGQDEEDTMSARGGTKARQKRKRACREGNAMHTLRPPLHRR